MANIQFVLGKCLSLVLNLILKAMIKARETEMQLKNQEPLERIEDSKTEAVEVSTTDTTQF